MSARERRLHRVALALAALLLALPLLVTRVLPLMDHSMLLAFARVALEHADPASPFHGVYTVGSPLTPTAAPVLLLAALGRVVPLDEAGRLLWLGYALGMLAVTTWLLRLLGRDRWAVLLVLPLVYGKWVSSGFVGFVTALPLVLLSLALALRALERRTPGRLVAVGLALTLVMLWHALMSAVALAGFGLSWLAWRAPGWRARLVAATPALAPAALMLAWYARTFTERAAAVAGPAAPPARPPRFEGVRAALDALPDRVLLLHDGARAFLVALGAALGLAVALALVERWRARDGQRGAAASLDGDARSAARPAPEGGPVVALRVNPLGVLAALAAVAYFALPTDALGVEIVGPRFAWVAAVLAVFALPLPRGGSGAGEPAFGRVAGGRARAAAVGALALVAAAYLGDAAARFRAFHHESVGAHRLIAGLPPRATLLAPVDDPEGRRLRNKPLRELQQYATVLGGALPSTSFAGYGLNYVRFVRPSPLPALFPHTWRASPRLTELDFVLLRRPPARDQRHPRLRLVRRDGDWWLFETCGAPRRPDCAARAPAPR